MSELREKIRLRKSDDGPVLDIDGTMIQLQVFAEYHHVDEPFTDYKTTIERTSDGSSWYLDSEVDGVPNILIEPHTDEDQEDA